MLPVCTRPVLRSSFSYASDAVSEGSCLCRQ